MPRCCIRCLPGSKSSFVDEQAKTLEHWGQSDKDCRPEHLVFLGGHSLRNAQPRQSFDPPAVRSVGERRPKPLAVAAVDGLLRGAFFSALREGCNGLRREDCYGACWRTKGMVLSNTILLLPHLAEADMDPEPIGLPFLSCSSARWSSHVAIDKYATCADNLSRLKTAKWELASFWDRRAEETCIPAIHSSRVCMAAPSYP